MKEVLPYIDRYFNGELSNEEKKAFEGDCLADPAFASMVAFYISLQEHSQQEWVKRKKQQFARLEVESLPADKTSFPINGAMNASGHYRNEEEQGDINAIKDTDEKAVFKEVAFVRSRQEGSFKQEEAKVRPMKRWKWLAIAVALLGVVATGITL